MRSAEACWEELTDVFKEVGNISDLDEKNLGSLLEQSMIVQQIRSIMMNKIFALKDLDFLYLSKTNIAIAIQSHKIYVFKDNHSELSREKELTNVGENHFLISTFNFSDLRYVDTYYSKQKNTSEVESLTNIIFSNNEVTFNLKIADAISKKNFKKLAHYLTSY